MRVWIVTIGEPLPVSAARDRPLRSGMLAEELLARGHEVTLWASTFDHARKLHRYPADISLNPEERFQVRLLHGIAYRRNVSVRRVINHIQLARKFRRQALLEPQPDLILCSLPTIELCDA